MLTKKDLEEDLIKTKHKISIDDVGSTIILKILLFLR